MLKVMHSRLIYGKNHKRIETVMHSGFPSHLLKEVKKLFSRLLRKDLLSGIIELMNQFS